MAHIVYRGNIWDLSGKLLEMAHLDKQMFLLLTQIVKAINPIFLIWDFFFHYFNPYGNKSFTNSVWKKTLSNY